MIDIRQVCKVFLEFVYNQNLLPEDIIEILKTEKGQKGDSLEWDFAEIMTILSWNIAARRRLVSACWWQPVDSSS